MKKGRVIKKIIAIFTAAIYLQVNVGWAGVATLPLPSILSRLITLKTALSTADDVLVFHSSQDEELLRQMQQQNTYARMPYDLIPKTEEIQQNRTAQPIAGDQKKQQGPVPPNHSAPQAPVTAELAVTEITSLENAMTDGKLDNNKVATALSDIVGNHKAQTGDTMAQFSDTYTLLVEKADAKLKAGSSVEEALRSVQPTVDSINAIISPLGLAVKLVENSKGTFDLQVSRKLTSQEVKSPTDNLISRLTAVKFGNTTELRVSITPTEHSAKASDTSLSIQTLKSVLAAADQPTATLITNVLVNQYSAANNLPANASLVSPMMEHLDTMSSADLNTFVTVAIEKNQGTYTPPALPGGGMFGLVAFVAYAMIGNVQPTVPTAPTAPQPTQPVAPPATPQSPAPTDTRPVHTEAVTPDNLPMVLEAIGYKGRMEDINGASINIQPGTQFVKRGDDVTLENGNITWTTHNGVDFTAQGVGDGKVQIDAVVEASAGGPGIFFEYAEGFSDPIAKTIYQPGSKETRVNGELTSFQSAQGITRELLIKPASSGEQQYSDQPALTPEVLKASSGTYKVREANVDSTFRMINNKVQLVKMEDNLTGAVLASRASNGKVHATPAGQVMGMEREFEVIGVVLDGTAILQINSFHQAGEQRDLEIKESAGAGRSMSNSNHVDKDLRIVSLGDGNFVKVATTNNAKMAGTMTLTGQCQQLAAGNRQNVTWVNAAGTVIAKTMDNPNIVFKDESGHVLPASATPLANVLTTTRSEIVQLAKAGVVQSAPIPELNNGSITQGEVVMKNGRMESASINYTMNDGATAHLSIQNNKAVIQFDTTRTAASTFAWGSTAITVPQGKNDIAYDLNGGFEANQGSYVHLAGVEFSNEAGTVRLTLNPNTKNIEAQIQHLNNGGQTQFLGQAVKLENKAVFDQGRIWFKIDGDGVSFTGQSIMLTDDVVVPPSDFKAKYIAFDGAARSVSAELQVKNDIVVPRPDDTGSNDGSNPTTPGASSQDLEITQVHEGTMIHGLNALSHVAITLTDTGELDQDGKNVLRGQINIFAANSTNLVVGSGGMEFAGIHFDEGMSLDIKEDEELIVRTGNDKATIILPSGARYDFDANTTVQMGQNHFDVLSGTVLLTETQTVGTLPPGLTVRIETPRQILIEAGKAPVLVTEGKTVWESDRDVVLDLGKGAKITIRANTTIETNGVNLTDNPVVVEGDGIRIEGPSQLDPVDGLDVTVTPQIIDVKMGGVIEIVQKGSIEVKVTKAGGFEHFEPTTGVGWKALEGSHFTAEGFDEAGRPEGVDVLSGEVKLYGLKEGFTRSIGENNAVEMKVLRQEVIKITAAGTEMETEGVVRYSGNNGDTLTLDEGKAIVLRFDHDNTSVLQEGANFRLADNDNLEAKATILMGEETIENVNGTQASHEASVVLERTSNGNQTRSHVRSITTDEGFKLEIKMTETMKVGSKEVIKSEVTAVDLTDPSEPLAFDMKKGLEFMWGGVAYKAHGEGSRYTVDILGLSLEDKEGDTLTVLLADGSVQEVTIESRTDEETGVPVMDLMFTADPDVSEAIQSRMRSTGVRYEELSDDGYFTGRDSIMSIKDDENKDHTGYLRYSDHTFRLASRDGFVFYGNQVVVVERSVPHDLQSEFIVETKLNADNIGKQVVALDFRGIHEGVIAYVPGGSVTVQDPFAASEEWELNIEEDNVLGLVTAIDDEGRQTVHLTSSYRDPENKFIIEAGSDFIANKDGSGLDVVQASLFAEQGKGDEIWIGGHKENSDSTKDRVAVIGGEDGQQSNEGPEWATVDRGEGSESSRLRIVHGRAYLVQQKDENEKPKGLFALVKTGTVLVDVRLMTEFNNPQRLRVAEADGKLTYAIQVFVDPKDKDKVAAKVFSEAQEMRFAPGAFGTNKEGKQDADLFFAIIDSHGSRVASFSVAEAKIVEGWVFDSEDKNLDPSNDNGRLEFREEMAREKDENGKTTYELVHIDRYSWEKNGDVVVQTGSMERGWVEGQHVIVERSDDKHGGYITKTKVVDGYASRTELDNVSTGDVHYEGDFVFEVTDDQGNPILDEEGEIQYARVDLASVRQNVIGNKGASDEMRSQARGNQELIHKDIGLLISRGYGSNNEFSKDHTVIDLAGHQAEGFFEYATMREDSWVFGASGFFKTVVLSGSAWVDLVAGTNLFDSGINFLGGYALIDEMEEVQGDSDRIRDATTAEQSETIGAVYKEMSERDENIWYSERGLDKLAGSIMGWERIMNLDTMRDGWWTAPKLLLCAVEQTANIIPVANLFKAAKGLNTTIKVAEATRRGVLATRAIDAIKGFSQRIGLTKAIGFAANMVKKFERAYLWAKAVTVTRAIVALKGINAIRAEQIALSIKAWKDAKRLQTFWIVAGQGLQLVLRRQALNSVGNALDVTQAYQQGSLNGIGKPLYSLKDVTGAWASVAWATALSEVVWLAPFMGKHLESSRVIASIIKAGNFGSNALTNTQRWVQIAIWGLGGAAGESGTFVFNYFMGRQSWEEVGGWSGLGYQALKGFAIGVVLWGVSRVLNRGIPNADNLKQAGATLRSKIGHYGKEAGIELMGHGRNGILGVIASLSHRAMEGQIDYAGLVQGESDAWGDVGNYTLQGFYLGVLLGGAASAVSNWGKAGRNVARDLGQFEANAERVKAGAQMGLWEVVVGEHIRIPFISGPEEEQHGSAMEQGLTLLVGNWLAKKIDRFVTTTINIGGLHYFFMFGRVGKNPLTDSVGGFAGMMKGYGEKALLDGRRNAAYWWNIGGNTLQNVVVMRLTIWTFQKFEEYAPIFAEGTGLISEGRKNKDGSIKYVDENGNPLDEVEQDRQGVLHQVFAFLGFINAPIHASISGAEKTSREKLQLAKPRLTDKFQERWVRGGHERVQSRIQEGRQAAFKLEAGLQSKQISETGLRNLQAEARQILSSMPEIQDRAARLGADTGTDVIRVRSNGEIAPLQQTAIGDALAIVKALEIQAPKSKLAENVSVETASEAENREAATVPEQAPAPEAAPVAEPVEVETNNAPPAGEQLVKTDGATLQLASDKVQLPPAFKSMDFKGLSFKPIATEPIISLRRETVDLFASLREAQTNRFSEQLAAAQKIFENKNAKLIDLKTAGDFIKSNQAEQAKVDAARKALGLQEGDLLVTLSHELKIEAHAKFLEKKTNDQLKAIAEAPTSGSNAYDPALQKEAIKRVHGVETATMWEGLRQMGASDDILIIIAGGKIDKDGPKRTISYTVAEKDQRSALKDGTRQVVIFTTGERTHRLEMTVGEKGDISIPVTNVRSAMELFGQNSDTTRIILPLIGNRNQQGDFQCRVVIDAQGNAVFERRSNDSIVESDGTLLPLISLDVVDPNGRKVRTLELKGDADFIEKNAEELGIVALSGRDNYEMEFLANAARQGGEVVIIFTMEAVKKEKKSGSAASTENSTEKNKAPPEFHLKGNSSRTPFTLRIKEVRTAAKDFTSEYRSLRSDLAQIAELDAAARESAADTSSSQDSNPSENTPNGNRSRVEAIIIWLSDWSSLTRRGDINSGGQTNINPLGLAAELGVRLLGVPVVLVARALGYTPSRMNRNAPKETRPTDGRTDREVLREDEGFTNAARDMYEARLERRSQNPSWNSRGWGQGDYRAIERRATQEQTRVLNETWEAELGSDLRLFSSRLRDPFGLGLQRLAAAKSGEKVRSWFLLAPIGPEVEATQPLIGAARSIQALREGSLFNQRAAEIDRNIGNQVAALEREFGAAQWDSQIEVVDRFISERTEENTREGRNEKVEDLTIAQARKLGLLLVVGEERIWNGETGLGNLSLIHFKKFAEHYRDLSPERQAEMLLIIATTFEFSAELTRVREASPDFNGKPFDWKEGQLFSILMSGDYNINMLAGGGKTIVQQVRALIEAMDTSTGESAVFFIVENEPSVNNALGKGKLLELEKFANMVGVEVVNLPQELRRVRSHLASDANATIEGVIEKMKHASETETGERRRRIFVVDFDTLGGALSEFKYQGFSRAYTDTQIRLFDEVHRVTTDPVTYVIGGSAMNDLGRARSREEFPLLRNLERNSFERENEGQRGIFEVDGKEFFRVETSEGEIEAIEVRRTSESEYENIKNESEGIIIFDAASGETPVVKYNSAAEVILQRAAGAEKGELRLNGPEIQSFLRGRLTTENNIDLDTTYVHDAMVDGKRDGQYRPIQRGIGIKENQVIEDIAYLCGLNARRAELRFRGGWEIEFKEDSGDFQVLQTIRGISRYEFFETTGQAIEHNRLVGFTATAAGYENFIELATGRRVLNTVTNSIGESIRGIQSLVSAENRESYYEMASDRLIEIAGEGVLFGSEREFRVLLGTQDRLLVNEVEAKLKSEGFYHRLYSRTMVIEVDFRGNQRVVNARENGVRIRFKNADGKTVDVDASQSADVVDAFVEGGSAGKNFIPLKRTVDSHTDNEVIQDIVKSFSEPFSIVIGDQRILTGKDFQQRGTIILADSKVSTGELIQNLERLGRNRSDGNGRWEANREVFMNQEDLRSQMMMVHGKFLDFSTLLSERVERELTAPETQSAMHGFETAVQDRMRDRGESDRQAVEGVIAEWSQSDPGSRNLLRLSTEFNLLSRNTGTAKTVANEIFFHHDLGRALNEAKDFAAGNSQSTSILEVFEEAFRSERKRSEEESFFGNEKENADKQIKALSESSLFRCRSLLEAFLRGDGAVIHQGTPNERRVQGWQLDARTYGLLADQLIRLKKAQGVDFALVQNFVADESAPMASFENTGRENDGAAAFLSSRHMVYERFRFEIAPAADSSRPAVERTVVQMMDSAKAKGMSKETVNRARDLINDSDVFSFGEKGNRRLTSAGYAVMDAAGLILDMNDDDREGLNGLMSIIRMQNGTSLSSIIGARQTQWGDHEGDSALATAVVLSDMGLLTQSQGNDFNTLCRFAAVITGSDSDAATLALTVDEVKTMLSAGIPGFDLLRRELAKNPKQADDLAVLNDVQAQAPMVAFLTWLGTEPDLLDQLQSEQTEARAYVDSMQSQGKLTQWMMEGGAGQRFAKFGGATAVGGTSLLLGMMVAPWVGVVFALICGYTAVQAFSQRSNFVSALAGRNEFLENEVLPTDAASKAEALSLMAIINVGSVVERKELSELFDRIIAIGPTNAPVLFNSGSLADAVSMSGGQSISANPWKLQVKMERGDENLSDFVRNEEVGFLLTPFSANTQKNLSFAGKMLVSLATVGNMSSVMGVIGMAVIPAPVAVGFLGLGLAFIIAGYNPDVPESDPMQGIMDKLGMGGKDAPAWAERTKKMMSPLMWVSALATAVGGNPFSGYPIIMGLFRGNVSQFIQSTFTQGSPWFLLSLIANKGGVWIAKGGLARLPLIGPRLGKLWDKIPDLPSNRSIALSASVSLKAMDEEIKAENNEISKKTADSAESAKLKELKKLYQKEKDKSSLQAHALKTDIILLTRNLKRAAARDQSAVEGRTLGRLWQTIEDDDSVPDAAQKREVLRVALITEGIDADKVELILAEENFDKLQDIKLDKFKDKDISIAILIEIGTFEASLGNAPVTVDGIWAYTQNQKTIQSFMDYYAGRKLSRMERQAIGKIEQDLRAFEKGKTLPPSSERRNYVAEIASALSRNNVRNLYGIVMAETYGNLEQTMGGASVAVAQAQKASLDRMTTLLSEAGASASDVDAFRCTVAAHGSPELALQVVESIQDRGVQPRLHNALIEVRDELRIGYYGELNIGLAAFQHNVDESEVQPLAVVAGVSKPFGKANWGTVWKERRALYQAYSMFNRNPNLDVDMGVLNGVETWIISTKPEDEESEPVKVAEIIRDNKKRDRISVVIFDEESQSPVQTLVLMWDEENALTEINMADTSVSMEIVKDNKWVKVEGKDISLLMLPGLGLFKFKNGIVLAVPDHRDAFKRGERKSTPLPDSDGDVFLGAKDTGNYAIVGKETDWMNGMEDSTASEELRVSSKPKSTKSSKSTAPKTIASEAEEPSVEQPVMRSEERPSAPAPSETVAVKAAAPESRPADRPALRFQSKVDRNSPEFKAVTDWLFNDSDVYAVEFEYFRDGALVDDFFNSFTPGSVILLQRDPATAIFTGTFKEKGSKTRVAISFMVRQVDGKDTVWVTDNRESPDEPQAFYQLRNPVVIALVMQKLEAREKDFTHELPKDGMEIFYRPWIESQEDKEKFIEMLVANPTAFAFLQQWEIELGGLPLTLTGQFKFDANNGGAKHRAGGILRNRAQVDNIQIFIHEFAHFILKNRLDLVPQIREHFLGKNSQHRQEFEATLRSRGYRERWDGMKTERLHRNEAQEAMAFYLSALFDPANAYVSVSADDVDFFVDLGIISEQLSEPLKAELNKAANPTTGIGARIKALLSRKPSETKPAVVAAPSTKPAEARPAKKTEEPAAKTVPTTMTIPEAESLETAMKDVTRLAGIVSAINLNPQNYAVEAWNAGIKVRHEPGFEVIRAQGYVQESRANIGFLTDKTSNNILEIYVKTDAGWVALTPAKMESRTLISATSSTNLFFFNLSEPNIKAQTRKESDSSEPAAAAQPSQSSALRNLVFTLMNKVGLLIIIGGAFLTIQGSANAGFGGAAFLASLNPAGLLIIALGLTVTSFVQSSSTGTPDHLSGFSRKMTTADFQDEAKEQGLVAAGNSIWLSPEAFTAVRYVDTEKIAIWQVKEVKVDGQSRYIYHSPREIRQLTFGAEERTSVFPLEGAALSQFTRIFPRTLADPQISSDASAVRKVAAILDPKRSEWASAAGQINIQRLLEKVNPQLLARFEVENMDRFMTLIDIANADVPQEFKNFVYQLVAYNAESWSSPNRVAFHRDVANGLIAQPGNIALQQADPGRGQPLPSLNDDGVFVGFGQLMHQAGKSLFPFLLSNQEPGLMTLFVPGEIVTIDNKGTQGVDLKPVHRAPAQSLLNPDMNRLFSFLRQFVPEFMGGADSENLFSEESTAVHQAVQTAWDLHFNSDGSRRELSQGNFESIWFMVGEYSTGRISDLTLDTYIRSQNFSSVDVDQLIRRLATQMRGLMNGNPGLARLAHQGLLPEVGRRVVHNFGLVSAMAKPPVRWLTSQINAEVSMALVEAKEARTLHADLSRRMKTPMNRLALTQTLLSLAGENKESFRADLRAISEGRGYFTASDVRNVLDGTNQDPQAQSGVLQLLLASFQQTAREATGLALGRTSQPTVRVLTRDEFDKLYGAGEGALHEQAGRIDIALDESLPADQRILMAIIVLMHETNHPAVERILAARGRSAFGVPTVQAEALVGHFTAQALESLNLKPLADMMRMKIYERIVAMDQEGAVYFTLYSDIKAGERKALERINRRNQGLQQVPILVANEKEESQARRDFGPTAHLVRMDLMTSENLKKSSNDSFLVAYAEQYLGTRRVRFMGSEESLTDDLRRLLFVGSKLDPAIVMVPLVGGLVTDIIQNHILSETSKRHA